MENIHVKSDFIRTIIKNDLQRGTVKQVHTRFPPEPNGYLHIGHAKSICLNFSLAKEFNGLCNVRLDDTNPDKENTEYVESILADIRWLGFDWEDRLFFASDYFELLYELAEKLIIQGKAYVDDLSPEEIRAHRGTLTTPGIPSPYRERSVEENLTLFRKMREGAFPDGHCVLRAKIDMASPNIVMRDPTLYRIRRAHHHRTGNAWCIYPMYDFTHCISDSTESISHSLCSLEFENNRELYDWILRTLDMPHVQQIEFARLSLSYTILSKRKLIQLVDEKYVDGWDDPRMPTLAGMRKRGFPAAAIRKFCSMIGVSRAESVVEYAMLEHCVREELNAVAPRLMVVRDPIKVVITNMEDSQEEMLTMPYFPEDDSHGSRLAPFTKELYIERDDFMESPPSKYFRLAPGKEVRLRYAYYITCTDIVKDDTGAIVEIHCTYDPTTKGGTSEDGRKVKGTLHWVSAKYAVPVQLVLYDHLFTVENPALLPEGKTFLDYINPHSKTTIQAFAEPHLVTSGITGAIQFERVGYFLPHTVDTTTGTYIYSRIITLKDTWAKQNTK